MPLPNHHYATFAGQQVLAADFLVLPGAKPSAAILLMIPQQVDLVPKIGDLVLSDGVHVITYYGCAIADHELEVVNDSRRASIWRVAVVDRRWQWKYQHINGIYNKRLPDGEFDILYTDDGGPYENTPPQKKSLRGLCELLLEAMQEESVDVSDLPDDIYPYVDWDYANPAEELERILDAAGRIYGLGPDNRVYIVEKGGTGTVGDAGTPTNLDHYWTRGAKPAHLMLVGGKTVVEAAYYLMPVGYEQDMSVKRQSDLSYAPDEGWDLRDPFNMQWIADGNDRSVAYASVYRTFRPWSIVANNGAEEHKWLGVEKENWWTYWRNLDQILPLADRLCDPQVWVNFSGTTGYPLDRHKRVHKPFVKWGQLRPYSLSTGMVNGNDYSAFYIPDCEVDTATGTVTFPIPVAVTTDTNLTLLCAHHVKDQTTGQYLRFTKTVDVPDGGYGTRVIHDDTVVRTVIYRYSPDVYLRGPHVDIVVNEQDVQAQADAILTEALREYTEHEQETELIGFVPINPESHIKHVHYQMRYNDAAFTTVRYTVAVSGE